ncbi:helix-turn-helix domain-containing protein [Nocardia tengchongensis]|uniref:helix-turn-helix domain-containing protein n=1 Tax=Nocardia tengchongensis TaxID=2055889 RepID=UPI0036CD40BB
MIRAASDIEASLMPSQFGRRLNALFDQWARQHQERLTNHRLVTELDRRGFSVSEPYVSQLRRGRRSHPSFALTEALADFFGVDPDYFGDGATHCDATKNNAVIADIHDDALRQLLSTATELSTDSLDYLIVLAARLRRVENLL